MAAASDTASLCSPYVTRGDDPEPFECLQGRVAIGTTAFVEGAKKLVGRVTKEQPGQELYRQID